MYHQNSPDVIEGTDILNLVKAHVERVGKRVFAHLHVELNPEKEYIDSGHSLHVAGAAPRLLRPTGDDGSADLKVEHDLKARVIELEEALAAKMHPAEEGVKKSK